MAPSDTTIGHASMLAERTARIVDANPHLRGRILGGPPGPLPEIRTRPLYIKGRYVSPSLTKLVALVARNADVSPEAIMGYGKKRVLVDVRFAIANLAEEFIPRLSAQACDDGMLRGQGMTIWYRDRHRDRLELFDSYLALYERCRAELLKPGGI